MAIGPRQRCGSAGSTMFVRPPAGLCQFRKITKISKKWTSSFEKKMRLEDLQWLKRKVTDKWQIFVIKLDGRRERQPDNLMVSVSHWITDSETENLVYSRETNEKSMLFVIRRIMSAREGLGGIHSAFFFHCEWESEMMCWNWLFFNYADTAVCMRISRIKFEKTSHLMKSGISTEEAR